MFSKCNQIASAHPIVSTSILVGLCALSFAGGYRFSAYRAAHAHTATLSELQDLVQSERQSGYTFINPLLECDIASGKIDKLLVGFQEPIKDRVRELIKEGDIEDAAIYFRDLNNGPWFGIKENKEFLPAQAY